MNQSVKINARLLEVVSPLLLWYDGHARILPWRENSEPYAVWISEIMLQQTRVEAVKPYFDRWMKALPQLSSLAKASEQEVMKLWEGLGYYSRVRNIHKAAKLVMEKYSGVLPSSFVALLTLPGIGEYTAGAIGSIAHQLPVPCVDGNVLRVVTRLTAEKSDISSAPTKRLLTEWVREIVPRERPGDFNQAMMELGATVCLPNGLPKCQICPIAFLCEAHNQNRMTDFPVKSAKPQRKIEKKTVLLFLNGNKAALRKRPETGLLAGLWEFPNYPGELSEEEVRRIFHQMDLTPVSLVHLKKSKHIFTHIVWEMTGYLAIVEDIMPGHPDLLKDKICEKDVPSIAEENSLYSTEQYNIKWIGIGKLNDELTLPSAFKTYYQVMENFIKNEPTNGEAN